MKRLPDAELEIMLTLWDAKEPVPRSWIEEHLDEQERWSPLTINTYLTRLTDKGMAVSERRGKANYYYPAVSREEYLKLENHSFLGRLYGNSINGFFAELCSEKKLTEAEIDGLQELLDEMRNKNND